MAWSTIPKGDRVMRRRTRYDTVTTARTNQWSVSEVNGTETRPGIASWGRRKVRPFSPPVTAVHVKMMT